MAGKQDVTASARPSGSGNAVTLLRCSVALPVYLAASLSINSAAILIPIL